MMETNAWWIPAGGWPLVLSVLSFFVIASYTLQTLLLKLTFLRHSNIKVRFFNALTDFIYFQPFGLSRVMALDSPSEEVHQRRVQAYQDLKSRLATKRSQDLPESADSVSYMADCRFVNVKVLSPLLKELELPAYYTSHVNRLENGVRMLGSPNRSETKTSELYLSANAVHVFPERIYDAMEEEIALRFRQSESKYGSIVMNEHITTNQKLVRQFLMRFCSGGSDALDALNTFRYSLSGTEAVEVALKDVRQQTNKQYIVRFVNAYHGHSTATSNFDPYNYHGNFVYLREMDSNSLDFIEKYHHVIAGVLVNPMQYFTGVNQISPPGEKLNIGRRQRTQVDFDAYAQWLHSLNDKCKYVSLNLTPVAFILDDIYFAFRHHEGFCSASFFRHPSTGHPLRPDVMIYGKGVAAGYPLSIVVGSERMLKKQDTKYLLKVNRTVGTMSAYSRGIIASNVFFQVLMSQTQQFANKDALLKLKDFNALEHLKSTNERFAAFTQSLNAQFEAKKLPLQLRQFANVFSMNYLNNSLYNAVYVQYLIANQVFVSNQSTGKFNLMSDWSVADLKSLENVMVKAAEECQKGGFFEEKRRMQWLTVGGSFLWNWLVLCYQQIMLDKHIDIEVSHNHPANKFAHFWSSVFMILFAYVYMAMGEMKAGFAWFLLTHIVRQSGHFFYEKQDRDIEKQKFGHKDGSKKVAAVGVTLCIALYYYCYVFAYSALGISGGNPTQQAQELLRNGAFDTHHITVDFKESYSNNHMWNALLENAAWMLNTVIVFLLTNVSSEDFVSICGFMTIVPHFAEICFYYGFVRGIEWILKILTDPFTDLLDFYHHAFIHPKWFIDFRKHGKDVQYKLNLKTKEITEVKKLSTGS